jgi:ATP-dependent DNA helicase RecG
MAELDPSTLEENQMVERKESFNERGLKTLCAFLNTDGGSLYVPVTDNGEVLEVPLTDQQLQNVANQVIDGLGVQPNIISHSWNGRDFIEIQVSKAQNPIALKGSYYIKVGNTTHRMSQEQLRARMLNNVPWDAQIAEGKTIEDLDQAEIKRFVQSGQDLGRISSELDPNAPEAILRRTNLSNQDGLTNAAILLFGKNPQALFQSARVRIGVFASETEVLNDKIAEGHLFQQVRRAEEIFKSHIKHGYKISDEEFTRIEQWEYPLPAFREGIMNAVIHRDYHRHGAEVQVKIFPDHLSIFSPGGLPDGLSVDELLDTHPSVKRNNLLADVFYLAGLIETFGTGISRIQKHLSEEGLPDPVLEDKGHSFVITFKQLSASQKSEVPISLNTLSIRQLEILKLAEDGPFQTSDLEENFSDVTPRTLRTDLKELVDRKHLVATGKTKSRKYRLNTDK